MRARHKLGAGEVQAASGKAVLEDLADREASDKAVLEDLADREASDKAVPEDLEAPC